MHVEPQKEHRWLTRMVGSWTIESEAKMGPDEPWVKSGGTEVVRALGEVWTLGEGEMEMPGGGTGRTIMTLGYDPQLERFVGSFIGSMMTNLWLYNGNLNADETTLILDAEGPNFSGTGTTKYQDSIEFVNTDHRILRSQVLMDDGKWMHFMTAQYRRTS